MYTESVKEEMPHNDSPIPNAVRELRERLQITHELAIDMRHRLDPVLSDEEPQIEADKPCNAVGARPTILSGLQQMLDKNEETMRVFEDVQRRLQL